MIPILASAKPTARRWFAAYHSFKGNNVIKKQLPGSPKRLPLNLAVGFMAMGLSACAITPEPLTLDQQLAQASADRSQMFDNQEPVTQAIDLDQAMARAVKYNLQQRLGLMERALEDNLLEQSSFDMLPKLAARAGWRGRDNTLASSSESIRTGNQSLEPSTSQDRSVRSADLQMSWNVLDFGIGYFGAKAQANKVLAAEERRRRVIADIIQQVRSAYWEAATAQRLQPQVQRALADARQALEQARQTERQRLLAPVDALRYQKGLLEMVRQLETVDGELATAKARLAGLMNLPPATRFDVVVPSDQQLQAPNLAYRLDDLEAMAMVRRPEVREESYQARNAVLETRAALLRLLPGASLFVGGNYDSNSYTTNNHWADAGVQVSWNLFNVLAYPAISRTGEAREALGEMRRQAMRMAVLTQVNVAWQQYHQATQLFERSNELQRIQNGILLQTENAVRSDAQTVLEQVRTSTETVLALRSRDRSFAQLQTAYGAIYQAAGLDPLPERLAGDSVAELARAIGQKSAALAQGTIQAPLMLRYAVSSTDYVTPQRLQPVKLDLWSSVGSLQGTEVVEVSHAPARR
ncbi:TolC family protein [Pseudomonas sp. Irchel 3E13]|uniref:TolC family protein n=1 Tax=Pseudomonas sp. Irchel 3E13 TaxID=2008975 RepID=UPI001C44000D|nr:TolC family protein [Pseudomonas sp. Irchel 3E13]